jgi:8-oxo-dGTP pyrophosphatase MutT (NUDIX family)
MGERLGVRAVAMGVVRRGDEILVSEGYDPTKHQRFWRPLGGTIEFGELGAAAVKREFLEEIATEVRVGRYLGTLENIFTFDGGHELVRIYEAEPTDSAFYAVDEPRFIEDDRVHVVWRPLDLFATEPLYPHGLLDLIAAPS